MITLQNTYCRYCGKTMKILIVDDMDIVELPKRAAQLQFYLGPVHVLPYLVFDLESLVILLFSRETTKVSV